MKRKLFHGRTLKHAVLAVPAAALMLGAAEAGTTVGLNFQAWYYDSHTTPQTVGYGAGYQTTGFPVTTKAFGVSLTEWINSEPLDCSSAISTTVSFGGLTAQVQAPNAWQSGIGALNADANGDDWVPQAVAPGNDEVTWGYLDDGNSTGKSPSVTVSGLASKFPAGYVVQTIAANDGVKSFNDVDITDGVTTNTVVYSTYYVANIHQTGYMLGGTVGVSAPSAAFTADTINILCKPKTSGKRSVLAGFIITDKPVVSRTQKTVTVNQGSTLTLDASVIGLATMTYQWQHEGTNYPGASTVPFVKTAVAADAGKWVLLATNAQGNTSSDTVAVTVNQVPIITKNLAGGTNRVYSGFNTVLSVVASGAEPLGYQWKKNGTAIPDATTAAFIVTNVGSGVSGYSITITNLYGTVNSATNYMSVVAAPDTYTPVVGQDSPASYWPLNETTGTTALDYAGKGHDGEQSNSITLAVMGPRPPAFPGFSAGNTAYQFDGFSSFIRCGNNAAISGASDFTVEAWVNTTASSGSQAIVHQRETGGGWVGAYRVSVNADGTVYFGLYGSDWQFNFSGSVKVNDGKWHHIAVVRNGTTGSIYVDGAMVGTRTANMQDLDGTIPVYIGVNHRDNNEYFSGMIASVAIYDKALSAAQIINHFAKASGTVLNLQLSPGGMVQDTKPLGTPHNGRNNGSTWAASSTDSAATPVTRTGIRQFAAANGSQIVIPADTDFDSTAGTFSFWIRVPAAALPGPGQEGAMLLDRRTTNGTVVVLKDDGSIFIQCAAGANSFSSGYLVDDLWHHVAVAYDQGASGVVSIYIDGMPAGSQANTAAWSWPTSQQIEIGRSHDGYWRRFDGLMDDFRIYNRVLTEAEIASIKSSDALVDESALKLRFTFDNALGVGHTVSWPYGTLYSSPVLGPSAIWTPVAGAVPPQYSFEPAGTSLFFRAEY